MFRNGSFMSTDRNFASGTMPPAKILVCFTWPAITAWLAPALFSRVMHLPSSPSEIQWIAARARSRPRRSDPWTLLPWWR